jgi:hypothetical protein
VKPTGDRDPGFVRDIRRLEKAVDKLKFELQQLEAAVDALEAAPAAGGGALSNNNPASLGTTDPGVDTEGSRSDHVHAHGNLAGGALHDVATGATAGFMAAADKTFLDTVDGRLDALEATTYSFGTVLCFSGTGLGTDASTRFFRPSMDPQDAITTTARGYIAPVAGKLKFLRVSADAHGGSNRDHVITVYVNGASTGITCTIAGNTNPWVGSDLTNVVTVAAGDVITLACTRAGTLTSPQVTFPIATLGYFSAVTLT